MVVSLIPGAPTDFSGETLAETLEGFVEEPVPERAPAPVAVVDEAAETEPDPAAPSEGVPVAEVAEVAETDPEPDISEVPEAATLLLFSYGVNVVAATEAVRYMKKASRSSSSSASQPFPAVRSSGLM